jgi:anaerobic C4-dicarboxylate transporter
MFETIKPKREVTLMAERKFRQAILVGQGAVNLTIPIEYARKLNIKPKTNLSVELVGRTLVITNADEAMDSKPSEDQQRTA